LVILDAPQQHYLNPGTVCALACNLQQTALSSNLQD
jgi:hypothetical protein